jgi:hypothetical protein
MAIIESLISLVRNHLHCVTEIVAASLLGDHRRIHLAGGDVGLARQVDVQEALVVTNVEIGLRSVLGDEHLAVLKWVHRAGIDIEIWVELLHRDPEPTGDQQVAETGSGEAFAE